jgi:hypothetical protein
MRHFLLLPLLLSSIVSAQEGVTEVDEASSNPDKSGNPILLKTNKLAAPTASAAQHQQTDLNFLRERAEVSTDTLISHGKRGDFSCPTGTSAACLDIGDKVCPSSTKCVDEGATCFDDYPCDSSEGFVCESEYDGVMNGYKQAVSQHNALASENVTLREMGLEIKNCVINAPTLRDAIRCVR